VQKMTLFKNTGNKKFWKELIYKLSLHFCLQCCNNFKPVQNLLRGGTDRQKES
jgi:hypothetical protein